MCYIPAYCYLQKNTFDRHKWQAQDRKGEMINKALRGEAITEMEDIGADEDSDASVDAATAMAITSGNPLVKEKIDIDKKVACLKTLQRNHMNEFYRYQNVISRNSGMIKQLTNYADNIEQAIENRNQYNKKPSIVIKGTAFEKQTNANKALFPMNESRRDISIVLRHKFISDSNYSTDVLNRMYENQERAEKVFNYSGSINDAFEYEKNSVRLKKCIEFLA